MQPRASFWRPKHFRSGRSSTWKLSLYQACLQVRPPLSLSSSVKRTDDPHTNYANIADCANGNGMRWTREHAFALSSSVLSLSLSPFLYPSINFEFLVVTPNSLISHSSWALSIVSVCFERSCLPSAPFSCICLGTRRHLLCSLTLVYSSPHLKASHTWFPQPIPR